MLTKVGAPNLPLVNSLHNLSRQILFPPFRCATVLLACGLLQWFQMPEVAGSNPAVQCKECVPEEQSSARTP